ncbi:hypothetical protein FB45DRAFT_896505 [Roridomyces roridus]|uniref:Mid2 domain-containing protein n=1 Tax=Roridomyces roridus TaxID=1738132 RepID=A0AAD7FUJ5_9AGAR|nr:hypothetical protein FB45DRAFT_896505 [Roridomyces roridus]
MRLLFSLPVLAVVTLGPQAVLGSFKVKIQSPVLECQPATLTFSGNDANNHSIPTTLTILPLLDNVQPINIDIPNGATNTTGIVLTFIPLPAGTQFIASLDDLQGPSAAASDVTPVQASQGASCNVSQPLASPFYQFNGILNQCDGFNVNFTTATAPNVTALTPRGGFISVAPTDFTAGVATYPPFRNLPRQTVIQLLFDDSDGHLQTTQLITVGGDSSSPSTCLKKPGGNGNHSSNDSSDPRKTRAGLPMAVIIGIAVGAGVIGLLAVLILLYFLRSRRRHRQSAKDLEFDPTLLNRRWPPEEKKVSITSYDPTSTAPMPVLFSGDGFVRNPIYTNEKYNSSIMSDPRTSISSWNQFVPRDQRSQRTKSWDSFDEKMPSRRPTSGVSTVSMNTADVHDIVQMATGDRSSGADLTEVPITPQQSTVVIAKPAVARLVSLRRNNRTEPDLPVSAISRNNSASAAVYAGGPYSYVNFGDSDEDEELPTVPVDGHTASDRQRETGDWGNNIVVR